MSSEMTSTSRAYRKRRRAELEAETRLRITEAAVHLHGSIGPARTTISAVAERAGVQRATVYRHFPNEEALFAACSSHWLSQHPLPDMTAWTAIEHPDVRLAAALQEMYRWYERGEEMQERVRRDVAIVPALRPAMEASARWTKTATEALMRGRLARGRRRRQVRAAIGHTLVFETWRSLRREQGLSEREAISLMAGMVAFSARPGRH